MDVSTSLANLAAPDRDSYRDLRFPQVFEAAAIGVALCHLDGRILEGNSSLARLLGYDVTELAGLDPWRFHETDSAGSSRLLADLIRGLRESFTIEKRCRRKNLSDFAARLTVSFTRDGRRQPAFLVILLEDLTEQVRLQQQVRQAEKMELMGRFATGVAHDFNNLLTGFLIYCDLLLSKLDPANPMHRHVEEMRQAGEQGSALTRQLLTFARKKPEQPRPVPLNELISASESLLRRLIGEHIEFIVSLDPAVGNVFADPAQLRQILLNLALNSRDAIRQNGKIDVRTRVTQFPESPPMRMRRPAVSLTVEDNGCGMSPETRAHLFEPFFTTKKLGEGTGMGLATVRRIVAEASGRIEVSSEPNRGTRIEIFFPSCETRASLADAPIAPSFDGPTTHSHNFAGDSSC
jgi:two-component system, cell cycle sensor histidine kinase and response regulator CckA